MDVPTCEPAIATMRLTANDDGNPDGQETLQIRIPKVATVDNRMVVFSVTDISINDQVTKEADQTHNLNLTDKDRPITAKWNPLRSADGYHVQWKSRDQDYCLARQTTVDATNYTIPNLVNGEIYTVRVIAANSFADGRPSGEERATPHVRTAKPLIIMGVVDTTITDGESVQLRFRLAGMPTAAVPTSLVGFETGDVLKTTELQASPGFLGWRNAQISEQTFPTVDYEWDEPNSPVTFVMEPSPEYHIFGDSAVQITFRDNDAGENDAPSAPTGLR